MTLKDHFGLHKQRGELTGQPMYEEKTRLIGDICRASLHDFIRRSADDDQAFGRSNAPLRPMIF